MQKTFWISFFIKILIFYAFVKQFLIYAILKSLHSNNYRTRECLYQLLLEFYNNNFNVCIFLHCFLILGTTANFASNEEQKKKRRKSVDSTVNRKNTGPRRNQQTSSRARYMVVWSAVCTPVCLHMLFRKQTTLL